MSVLRCRPLPDLSRHSVTVEPERLMVDPSCASYQLVTFAPRKAGVQSGAAVTVTAPVADDVETAAPPRETADPDGDWSRINSMR